MRDPRSLVVDGARQYGRFTTRPGSVNPLDEFGGMTRALCRLRLKEWVGFTLVHPDWFSSLIMQDANYLASSEIYAYDRARGTLYQHAANARGGSLRMPAALRGSSPVFAKPGYRVEYEFAGDGTRHRLRFDIAAMDVRLSGSSPYLTALGTLPAPAFAFIGHDIHTETTITRGHATAG